MAQELSREDRILGADIPLGDHIAKVDGQIKMATKDLNVYYGSAHAIKHVSV